MAKKIRVGMDISQLAHKGGVATYTRNLSEKLSQISELEMVYFYSSLRKPYQQAVSELTSSAYKGGLRNVKSYRLPPSLFEMLFNRWRNIGIEKFIGPVDIFHSSDWTEPPSKAKKITTYHDLVALKYPDWSHPKIVAVHKRKLKLVEKQADAVIAVSESTKKDLLKISSIPEDKIVVIYEGPTADFKRRSVADIKKFKEKYSLPDKLVLAIGGIGERRNLRRIKQAASGYNLVIAGVSLPWLSTEELELLYNSAEVLLYCSLYEGFGIPMLDAFCCGLPVITSEVSSMPEIGGDAAIYVDPYDTEDIKKKLKIVVNDKAVRQNLIKKGLARVKEFSWDKAAEKTTEIYRRLIR